MQVSGVDRDRRCHGWEDRAAGLLLLRASQRERTVPGLCIISSEPVVRVGSLRGSIWRDTCSRARGQGRVPGKPQSSSLVGGARLQGRSEGYGETH